ncbi:TRAUB-domain-containing protein [Ceratobasidium sp. AG-Ba]|nr:TRAUB-domain-containing protein [Ceratobasidium sp. AG-Ba]QRW02801.1 TRAUB-domain-containing protein [Ceratobasidium sp. AG-Ba]
MAGRLTLAEQIAQLDDAAPTDVDIERFDQDLAQDGELHKDLLAGRSHYLDVDTSSLRKQRDALVDAKYNGARTARNQLYEFGGDSDDRESESKSGGSEISSEDELHEREEDDQTGIERGNGASSGGDQFRDENDEDKYSNPLSSIPNERGPDQLTESLRKNREADKEKGRAVIQQRGLFDSLVEIRIRMQKAAVAANRLPHPNQIPPYVASDEGRQAAQSLLRETLAFSHDLFALRKRLFDANEPDIQPPWPKRRKLESEGDYEEQVHEATTSAAKMDAAYHPSCVQTLHKWSSKIAAVTPTLTSRSKSFRGGGAPHSAVELIEDSLGESGVNGGKAIGRTRTNKSGGARIGTVVRKGESEEQDKNSIEGDAEVFDDLDFYQSLLRDVIDSRTGGDEVKDWATRQKLKKAKRVVDTKASKGRKLRYEVHEKLQNFMVPLSTGTWHEEQIDELFANLLGRGIGPDRSVFV